MFRNRVIETQNSCTSCKFNFKAIISRKITLFCLNATLKMKEINIRLAWATKCFGALGFEIISLKGPSQRCAMPFVLRLHINSMFERNQIAFKNEINRLILQYTTQLKRNHQSDKLGYRCWCFKSQIEINLLLFKTKPIFMLSSGCVFFETPCTLKWHIFFLQRRT